MKWIVIALIAAIMAGLMFLPVRLRLRLVLNLAAEVKDISLTLTWLILKKELTLWQRHTAVTLDELLASEEERGDERAGVSWFQRYKRHIKFPPNKPIRRMIRVLNWLADGCSMRGIEWDSRLGCNDAMYTAIGAGALWALKGNALSRLSRQGQLRDLRLRVVPAYEQPGLYSSFSGIFKTRLAHIIVTGLSSFGIILGWWLHGNTKRKRTSAHRKPDADRHAEHQGNG